MNRSIIINGISVSYIIKRSCRKTVGLQICKDGCIEVRTPYLYSVASVEDIIRRHSRWILKRLEIRKTKNESVKNYVSGEYHYFLGEKYLLQVTEGERNTIKFENNCFIVTATSPNNVEMIMENWYGNQATAIFQKIAEPIIKQFEKYNVAPKKLTIKKMHSRWGSCSRKGNISLNLELIKLPEGCIREVIVHELSHLVYFNHSKDFYALMEREMPDCKEWKNKLKFL